MLHSDHRASRALVYVILLTSGFLSFTPYNVSFYESIALKIIGVFLIAGSVIALTGYMKRDNSIEILGSPLLVTALGALSLSALIPHADSDSDQTRWLVSLLLIAFALSLQSRFRDLQALIALRKHMEGKDQ